jgi:hypothetical protein
MKKQILSLSLLLSAIGVSAQTVNAFYPVNSSTYTYTLATAPAILDETATGANVTWSFNNLMADGYSETTVHTPTAEQVATYPGTASVVTTTVDAGTASEFFLGAQASVVKVTGAASSGIILNYNTANLSLGSFPKLFSDTATGSTTGGTFSYSGINGTFTGTGTTSVDGYGTLNVSIGSDGTPQSLSVTRLKIQQNITLFYLGAQVGTLAQVLYTYYAAAPADAPVFRTLTTTVVAPAFSLNETQQSIESYYVVLGLNEPAAVATIAIAPNPVGNVLHLTGTTEVKAITVTDASGRIVLHSNAANDVSVGHLSAGMYYVTVEAGATVQTLKMLKQ